MRGIWPDSWRATGAVLFCVSTLTACTHQVVMPTGNLWQTPGQQEQKTPVVAVLRVEDAITNPEQQKDPKSLGHDVARADYLIFIPVGYDTNEYLADRDRAQVVQDGMAAMLTDMRLPAGPRAEASVDQQPGIPDGQLVLHTKLRSFEISHDMSWRILLYANETKVAKLKAHVVMDCQLFQPGQATPLWRGTVEGNGAVDVGMRGYVNQEPGTVVRKAIEDAVKNLVAQSGIKQLSAKLQSEAQARFLAKVQERESSGDLQGTLTLYLQAYRTAMSPEQTTAAVAGIARVMRKMASKPILPEEARKFGVQATSLVEKKRYSEATALYQKALEIAPWWAEGHFNRALVLADQHRFQEAIAGMKNFVALAPDSTDARAAQDKLYEWELEAK